MRRSGTEKVRGLFRIPMMLGVERVSRTVKREVGSVSFVCEWWSRFSARARTTRDD
jgi:hypothetical protein